VSVSPMTIVKPPEILMGHVLGLRLHAVLLLGLLILALQCVQQGVPAFVERVRRVGCFARA
jgi:hypothetical protein